MLNSWPILVKAVFKFCIYGTENNKRNQSKWLQERINIGGCTKIEKEDLKEKGDEQDVPIFF